MSLWAEVWRRPGHATPGRVIDGVPSTNFGLHDVMSRMGDGNMRLPGTFDRFDEILLLDPAAPSSSVSSLIRYFSDADPTTPIFEWLPTSIVPTESKDDPDVEITGHDIKAIMGYARTEAFDWDGTDDWESKDPDWLYGGLNRVRNGGLEDNPTAISNPGFEDGTLPPWWPGAVQGVSANASVVTTAPRTGTFHASVTALLQEGGMSTTIRVFPERTYTVSFFGRTDSGSAQWQLGASGPQNMVPGSGAAINEVEASPGGWEVQDDLVHTTTYAQHSVTFTTAPGQTSSQISIRYAESSPPKTLYVDDITVAGFGVGTDPWLIHLPNLSTENFGASADEAHTGSWSLEFSVKPGGYVYQALAGAEPGVTYSASVWIFGDAGELWSFEARDARNNRLAQDSLTAAGGTWEELQFTFTVGDFLPGGDGVIELRIVNENATTSDAWVDDLIFFQGQLPDTIGKIIGDLYDDATTGHSTRLVWEDESNPGNPYLTLDFTDSVDSNGVAWVDSGIEIRIWMRMTYLQVMEQFSRSWGYEWRIVPDDVEAGTWKLQIYNPGTMKTDYTTSASPAIQGGSSDTRRSIRRYLPATDYLVEGEDRITSRDRDGDLVTALGRIEASRLDRELPELAAVIDAAFEDKVDAIPNSAGYNYVLVNPQDEPLVDYVIGDLLTIHDPPQVEDEARLMQIVGSFTPSQEEYEVEFVPATAAGS